MSLAESPQQLQFRQALVTQLAQTGTLQKLKAQLRTDAYHAARILQQKKSAGIGAAITFQHDLNLLHNNAHQRLAVDLVLEFMAFYELTYTMTVLGHEGNIPAWAANVDKHQIARDANLSLSFQTVKQPILIQLITSHMQSATTSLNVLSASLAAPVTTSIPLRTTKPLSAISTSSMLPDVVLEESTSHVPLKNDLSDHSLMNSDNDSSTLKNKKKLSQSSMYALGSNKSTSKLSLQESIKSSPSSVSLSSLIPKPTNTFNNLAPTSISLDQFSPDLNSDMGMDTTLGFKKITNGDRLSHSSSASSVHSMVSSVSENIVKKSSRTILSPPVVSPSMSRSASGSDKSSGLTSLNESNVGSITSSPSQKSQNIERLLLDDSFNLPSKSQSNLLAIQPPRTIATPRLHADMNHTREESNESYGLKSPELDQFNLSQLHSQGDIGSPLSLLGHLTLAKNDTLVTPYNITTDKSSNIVSLSHNTPRLPLPPLMSPFAVPSPNTTFTSTIISGKMTEAKLGHSSSIRSSQTLMTTVPTSQLQNTLVSTSSGTMMDVNSSLYDEYKHFERSMSKEALRVTDNHEEEHSMNLDFYDSSFNGLPTQSSTQKISNNVKVLGGPQTSTPAKASISIDDLLNDSALFKVDSDHDLITTDYTVSPPSEVDHSYLQKLQAIEGIEPSRYTPHSQLYENLQ